MTATNCDGNNEVHSQWQMQESKIAWQQDCRVEQSWQQPMNWKQHIVKAQESSKA